MFDVTAIVEKVGRQEPESNIRQYCSLKANKLGMKESEIAESMISHVYHDMGGPTGELKVLGDKGKELDNQVSVYLTLLKLMGREVVGTPNYIHTWTPRPERMCVFIKHKELVREN